MNTRRINNEFINQFDNLPVCVLSFLQKYNIDSIGPHISISILIKAFGLSIQTQQASP